MNIQLVESIKQMILTLSPEEQEWLRVQFVQDRDFSSANAIVDLNEFSGVIQLNEDPLAFQRKMREEWL